MMSATAGCRPFLHLRAGTYELACHPGLFDPDFSPADRIRGQREAELQCLTDRNLRAVLDRYEIRLISYGDLWQQCNSRASAEKVHSIVTIELAVRTVFWVSGAAVAYVYFGYPLLLRIGLFGKRKPLTSGAPPMQPPMVTVIIAARNEESGIDAKLKNLLSSNYPRERLEILVGSDGSSDRTEELVRPLAAEGVGLISFPIHRGKSAMQNRLVAAASGSILVFTDADCLVSRSAISEVVENFRDPAIGLVTGRPIYVNRSETGVTENEGTYLQYETWLREQESARGILAVASGSFFALRRSLWSPLEAHLGDDFALPLHVAQSGFRNVLDPRVVAETHLSQSNPAAMVRLEDSNRQ